MSQRKTYNHGFDDYYYQCNHCHSENVEQVPSGGFSPPNLICNDCGGCVTNTPISIPTQVTEIKDVFISIEKTDRATDVLSYVKEKIAIVEQMEKEDNGLDYGHSQFLSGLGNAYEDIRFELENGLFYTNKP